MDQAGEQFPIHDALEEDIRELTPIVRGRAEALGAGREREAVGEGIREFAASLPESRGEGLPPSAPRAEVAPAAVMTKAAAPILSSLPAYFNDLPPDIRLKVEELIDLAWHKGIRAALRAARAGGALVIDALHDALAGKLHDEFKRRGIL